MFLTDSANDVYEQFSVTFRVPDGTTPQQFRSIFTQALLDQVASQFPTASVTASDCLIDVVQRGN